MPALTIKVGSKNKAKVSAVEEILQEYSHLKDAQVEGVIVSSEISEQPMSLEELSTGATNRARNAFQDCDYSIGIESGFMKVPQTKSGYMDICMVAIFDGMQMHVGLSSGFETPDSETMRLVIEDGLGFAQAANKTGLSSDEKVGQNNGVIGELTNGKVDRKEFTKQALRTALIHIDKHGYYGT